MATTERNVVDELAAIKAVAEALEPLSDAGRRHVIGYVADLLGIAGAPAASVSAPSFEPSLPPEPTARADSPTSGVTPLDIRSLKEQKQPRSANEMAALVAYYVSELLPPDEQRAIVTSADIEKYFKQANYRLPSRVAQTLPDAARAGYFDAVDRGQYKLNPVGYNLVAHGLPSKGAEPPSRAARSRKAAPARRAVKKATSSKAVAKTASSRRAPQNPGARAAAKRSASKRS